MTCSNCQDTKATLFCLVCGTELCPSEVCKDKHEDKCGRYDTLPDDE